MMADLLDLGHPLYWTVEGVLGAAECAALIERIDAAGPEGVKYAVRSDVMYRADGAPG